MVPGVDRLVSMSLWRIGLGILGIVVVALSMILLARPGVGGAPPAGGAPFQAGSAQADGLDGGPADPSGQRSSTASAPTPARDRRHAVLSSLIKVRPERTPPLGEDRIDLRALRGECELAQIALTAADEPLRSLRPSLEGSLGPGVEVHLYRQELVVLARPSGPEGQAGRWPDPLIPDRDPLDGQRRSAFPFDVPAGESRAILLEACVDPKTSPGTRTASLRIEGPAEPLRIPLALRIEAATIPATSSLPTSFGFSALRAALGHHGRRGSPQEVERLSRRYREVLLSHRLSVHGGTMEPPPFRRGADGAILPDFRGYDRELAPFLEGTALPSGARATTAELRTHPALRDDGERMRYWAAIARHHREKGWEAILFDYAKDEPERDDLPAIATRARLVKRADPTIRILVTASLDPSLLRLVDLWTPNLNCLWVKERPDEFCPWRAPRAAYRSLEGEGAALWWYQSCSSHGCSESPAEAPEYFHGWPSYVIDAPGTRARIMGWIAWLEGIEGELYWDTVHGYAPEGRPQDPWAGPSLRAFGGNGDGTLLYPGTPARIGGTSHVPVTSLRLKQIRDGLEDLELLRLVAARPGGVELARRLARPLAPTPFQVQDDPEAMEGARRKLLDFLAGP